MAKGRKLSGAETRIWAALSEPAIRLLENVEELLKEQVEKKNAAYEVQRTYWEIKGFLAPATAMRGDDESDDENDDGELAGPPPKSDRGATVGRPLGTA